MAERSSLMEHSLDFCEKPELLQALSWCVLCPLAVANMPCSFTHVQCYWLYHFKYPPSSTALAEAPHSAIKPQSQIMSLMQVGDRKRLESTSPSQCQALISPLAWAQACKYCWMIKKNRYLIFKSTVLSVCGCKSVCLACIAYLLIRKMKIQVTKHPSSLVMLVTDSISLVRTRRSFRKPTIPDIVLCLILYLSFIWYSCWRQWKLDLWEYRRILRHIQ